MKSIRKSFGSHKETHISSPLPPLSKPGLTAIQPPMKVIRAIQSHKSNSPHQLSFQKGDFFHVTTEPKDGQWYEASNPSTGARGLVPVHMFEEFMKGSSTPRTPLPLPEKRPETPSAKTQAFYAVVLHDFSAERADELDAKAGDAVTVVAQSNREWLVAKPIGKLGRPGLIPVAFVEIRDPATGQPVEDVGKLIEGGSLPPVEEWKRKVMNYKANSISLGVLDESGQSPSTPSSSAGRQSAHTPTPHIDVEGPSPNTYTHQQPLDEPPSRNLLPEGILTTADVKSFHFEMDEYWFRVHAVFQPYEHGPLPPAKELVLFRSYNDFYDFQVSLLDAFPREAGRQSEGRMLPYMPGPVPHVDSQITMSRRQELDEYLQELCSLADKGVRHVIESEVVREFFSVKPGDASADIEPQARYVNHLSRSEGRAVNVDVEYGVDERLSKMRLSGGPDSGYEESEYLGKDSGSPRDYDPRPGHYRTESTASMYRSAPSRNTTHSRSSSRNHSYMDRPDSYGHARNGSSLEIDTYSANGYPRSSMSSNDRSPIRSSHAPSVASSQGRTPSSANPPISSSISQTAFVKIKIFDKASDDLVAIRVHPRVTHAQLMDKVQSRLGDSITSLRYRDSVNNALVELMDDEELRLWLDNTDRLVLYADSD